MVVVVVTGGAVVVVGAAAEVVVTVLEMAVVAVVVGAAVEVVVAGGTVVDVEDDEATLVEVEATAVVVWTVDPNWYRFMRLLPPQNSELFPAQAYEQPLTSCSVLLDARVGPQKHS